MPSECQEMAFNGPLGLLKGQASTSREPREDIMKAFRFTTV